MSITGRCDYRVIYQFNLILFDCSDKLQIALGLDRRDVPPWIFRMRECGYPPGWIRSCVVESCGLTFFNEDDAQEDSASDGNNLSVMDFLKTQS